MCNTTSVPAMSAAVAAAAGDKDPLPGHVYLTLPPFSSHDGKGATLRDKTISPSPLFPPVAEAAREAAALGRLALPIAVTALLLYSRSALSMFFLGALGDLPLAAGALAVAFANITGYSVLSGLSLGMEPLCSQAFGANQPRMLSVTLHRSVLFLLCSSMPISILWLNMSKIMLCLGQDAEITSLAQKYLLFSLPDLFSFSLIHPLRIYLRSQGITLPLAAAAAAAVAFHVPVNYVLVWRLGLGVAGVAAAASASNFALLCFLLLYVRRDPALLVRPTAECMTGWGPLARLAAPSCVSVCLEWWWYELMILLCGLLPDPKPAVASMGVLMQTTALVYVFPSSLGFGVSTRVGNELGANRPGSARAAAHVAVGWAAAMGLAATGFAAGMRHIWGGLFTSDLEIRRLTAAALPIVGICELGNCPQTVGCGVLRGSARPSHAARVNLGAFYLVGMPVAVGLGFGLGVGFCGLWLGLLAAQVCCAGLMLYVVGSTDWEAQARRAQDLTSVGPTVVKDVAADDGEADNMAKDDEEKARTENRKELCYEPLISIKMAEHERW